MQTQGDPTGPKRIVLNFSAACNMACPWCFVPFRGKPQPDAHVCTSIVRRCAELGFRCITFGGGDPFAVPFLSDLLREAKRLGLVVHVDTNGLFLHESAANAALIAQSVDLLGLPLDGPDPTTHDQMRAARGHFDLVRRRLTWLSALGTRIKINTMLSAVNVHAVRLLEDVVTDVRPARWSLYQYWPLSNGRRAAATHRISTELFQGATSTVGRVARDLGIAVEIAPSGLRRRTYPIVSDDGSVYVHSLVQNDEFDVLGTIFSVAVGAEVTRCCGPERPDAAERYSVDTETVTPAVGGRSCR